MWIFFASVCVAAASWADDAASRHFTFTCATTVRNLTPGDTARIWLPIPPEDREQMAEIAAKSIPATNVLLGRDPKYGNQMLYFSASAGAESIIHFSMSYRVIRHPASEEPVDAPGTAMDEFSLTPDTLVPVGGKSLSLIKDTTLPSNSMDLGRFLFDVVDDHMQYRKDKPGWGRGDSDWACQSGFGNCTDFHSIFISLARAEHLRAKFQIGFSIPPAIGGGDVAGYHCWAWFKPDDHGWVPVDISEANKHPEKRDYYFGHLDANRIAFTTGRDLILDPKQDGPPLNYFVFPYVEVRGEPYPTDNVITHCTYEDVNPTQASANAKH
jgi:hypothetical protein